MSRKSKKESFDEDKHSFPIAMRELREYEKWLDLPDYELKDEWNYKYYLDRYKSQPNRKEKKLTEDEYNKLLAEYKKLQNRVTKDKNHHILQRKMEIMLQRCFFKGAV